MVVAYTAFLRIVTAVTCTAGTGRPRCRSPCGRRTAPPPPAPPPDRCTLDHELRIGRHFEIAGHRLGELHRRTPQEAGEDELVDVGRQRRARAVHARRIAPMAMHTGIFSPRSAICRNARRRSCGAASAWPRVLAQLLHAVHAHVADAAHRVLADHRGQRDVRAAVLGPAGEHGSLSRSTSSPATRLLTRRRAAALHARRELGHLHQARQQRACPGSLRAP
jgi:hypothetical protein